MPLVVTRVGSAWRDGLLVGIGERWEAAGVSAAVQGGQTSEAGRGGGRERSG